MPDREHVRADTIHGERFVRARRRDGARAHDRQHAARGVGARASRAPAAIRVSAPEAGAERVGDAEALFRPPPRRRAGAGRRPLDRVERPRSLAVASHGGRPVRGAADELRDRQHGEPHELAVRLPQAARGRVRPADRESARLRRRRRPRARKRFGGARFHGDGANARELRPERSSRAQRANQRGLAPRRGRAGRARRVEQPAAGDRRSRPGRGRHRAPPPIRRASRAPRLAISSSTRP